MEGVSPPGLDGVSARNCGSGGDTGKERERDMRDVLFDGQTVGGDDSTRWKKRSVEEQLT